MHNLYDDEKLLNNYIYVNWEEKMKLTIKKRYLQNAIQQVTYAISSRTVIPILAGLKFDIKEDKVILTGSNSDITIQTEIEKVIDDVEIITEATPGSIVLPIPHFSEIIKKLPDETVHIEVSDNYKTVITSGRAVFMLYGQSSEEYPLIPLQEDEEPILIKGEQLEKLINQTVFAVSPTETRPILTGVHVAFENNSIVFTATDSHRLALRSFPIQTINSERDSVVIPGKNLQELTKLITNPEEEIKISILNNQILFTIGKTFFLSRLLSGNYPDTSRLIPQNKETTIHAFTKDLIQTIERADLLSNRDQNNVIRLDTLDGNMLEISSNSPEIGNVEERLEAIAIEGDPLKISFSSKYMLDTLKTIDSERVQIDFTGAMRPFVIRTPEDENILQLILPVRTF